LRSLWNALETELDVQSREALPSVRRDCLDGVSFGAQAGVADGVVGASGEVGTATGVLVCWCVDVDGPAFPTLCGPFGAEVVDGLAGVIGDDVDMRDSRARLMAT